MFKLADYSQQILDLRNRIKMTAEGANIPFTVEERKDDLFHVVFAGQYSAGKSSIIKAMTGRNDIKTGPGITTEEVTDYKWSNIRITDTPGIKTGVRPDHDEIAEKAIVAADLLVFVVTNELFDSTLGEYFKKLAVDEKKANQMILVVNKMTRAVGGNNPEQREIIREEIRKIIVPFTPEQMGLCFMDAESYLKSIEVRPKNPELADKYLKRSGFEEFIDILNRFVREKNVTGRLTSELNILDDYLQRTIQQLEKGIGDMDLEALENTYMNQRELISETRDNLLHEIKGICIDASIKTSEIGLNAANSITINSGEEDLKIKLKKAEKACEDVIDNCRNNAKEAFERSMQELGEGIKSIENEPVSVQIKINLESRFETLPGNIKRILKSTSDFAKDHGSKILDKARSSNATGMKLTGFSHSSIHDIVVKGGHMLNVKFKPWQAVKIARGIGAAGAAVGALGSVLGAVMVFQEEKEEEQKIENLRLLKRDICIQFNNAADEIENYGKEFADKNVRITLNELIKATDQGIQEIRSVRSGKTETCSDLEEIHNQIQQLAGEINAL